VNISGLESNCGFFYSSIFLTTAYMTSRRSNWVMISISMK